MDQGNQDKFEQILTNILRIEDKMDEQTLAKYLLSDLEYVRRKFVEFQADILEHTLIASQLQVAIWEFADYCAGIQALLTEDYDAFDNPGEAKQWRKILLNQVLRDMNDSQNGSDIL